MQGRSLALCGEKRDKACMTTPKPLMMGEHNRRRSRLFLSSINCAGRQSHPIAHDMTKVKGYPYSGFRQHFQKNSRSDLSRAYSRTERKGYALPVRPSDPVGLSNAGLGKETMSRSQWSVRDV